MPYRIFKSIEGRDVFVQRKVFTAKNGIHPLIRATVALRVLEYRQSTDSLDECIKMGEDSIGLSMRVFCKLVC